MPKPDRDQALPPVVKQVRQLRTRSERERTGTYYIEGARIVAQAIQAGAEITQGVIAPDLIKGTPHALDTVAALRDTGVPVAELSPSAFEGISFKENLQGIGAVVRYHSGTLADIPASEERVWVALDGVGNPGNLGAIMRTCDATGVAGLLLLGDTTDPYHPTAIRASMGSFYALQMIRAGFEEFVRWTREHDYTVIGTSPTATDEYHRVTYPARSALLMGSERLGLSIQQQAACDLLVKIPMVGTADSLNLGVATSVVLYEIFNQHRDLRQDKVRQGAC